MTAGAPSADSRLRDRCTPTSHRLGEPLVGTASTVLRWLLVEQPGPWGAAAFVQSRLGADIGAAVRQHAVAAGVRPLLIRRPGRPGRPPRDGSTAPVTAYVARSGPGPVGLTRLALDRPEQVLDLDLRALLAAAMAPAAGGGIYLVCTNGRHDPCCAIWGRPLALSLAGGGSAYAGRVWECSHIGGDRFAGNVVCLPHGLYYGRLSEPAAHRAVEAYEDGRTTLEGYRGRSAYPFAVQAAEEFIRRETRVSAIDDLTFSAAADGVVEFVARDGRRLAVRVRVGSAAPARPLTCGAAERRPPAYAVTWAAPADPDPADPDPADPDRGAGPERAHPG